MKEHKKMYKRGKLWVTATLFALALGIQIGSSTTASADTVTSAQQATTQTSVAAQPAPQTEDSSYNKADQGNYAALDSVQLTQQGQLDVSGWHATNAAVNRPNHWLIAYDQTAQRELSRGQVQSPVARPDVARVHDVYGAANAGFQAQLALTPAAIAHGDAIQVVSRYTDDPAGNGNPVDYWFAPVKIDSSNAAHLDQVQLSANQLTITGWHATNLAADKPNHYLIVLDSSDYNRELGRIKVDSVARPDVARPDVARAFPAITTAARSGFSGSFDLTNWHLDPQHQYSVVSRYSTSADPNGNGGDGQYTDEWLSLPLANRRSFYFDQLQMTAAGLRLAGWAVDSSAPARPYAYVIVLSDGREIGRSQLTLTARPDIARLYPQTFNSLNSGFNTVVHFDPAKVGQQMQVLVRFTDDPAGNGNASDQASPIYSNSAGYLDQLVVTPTTLQLAGWHISDQTAGKPYQYLIALGQNGSELKRWRLTDLTARPDVTASFPAILGNDQAGFAASFAIPANMYGQTIQLIHRYSDDQGGNGHYTDWYAAPFYIPAAVADPRGIQRFAGNTYYFDPTTRQPVTNRWVDGVYFGADGRMTNGQFSARIINWFVEHEGRLTYSQRGARNGSDGTADCSGSMTAALQAAGATAPAYVYATSNITPYLLQNGYRLIYQGDNEYIPQYGDIVIWGHINNPWESRHIVIASGSSDNQRAISVCWLTRAGINRLAGP